MEQGKHKPKLNSMEGFVVPKKVRPETPEKPEPKEEVEISPEIEKTELEDQKTDQIIDDIVLDESNSLMKIEDQNYEEIKKKPNKKQSKLRKTLLNKWNFVGIFAVLIIVFAVPYTRYGILGAFISNKISVQVVDNDTTNGISGVAVKIDNKNYKTDASGIVSAKLKLGNHKLTFTKPYFKSDSKNIFVGLSAAPVVKVSLLATGRPVNILVENKLDGTPVQNASINILDTSYLTDSNGKVRMILPTTSESYDATVSALNYLPYTATILQSVNNANNLIDLVPSGTLYYLAESNNKVNLVSSNLDGSDQRPVISGTGKENIALTKLYKSTDLSQMILYSNRDGSKNNQLYLVNKDKNSLYEIDKGTDFITPLGWIGNSYFYKTTSSSLNSSQDGFIQIKEFNPTNNTLSTIDSSTANLTDTSNYAYQSFENISIIGNQLVYLVVWNTSGTFDASNLSDQVKEYTIGAAKAQSNYSFNAKDTQQIALNQYSARAAYISVSSIQNNKTYYYNYSNGSVSPTAISAAVFSASYPQFYLSPDQSASLWFDGSGMYLGMDTSSKSNKLKFDGYNFYGWFNKGALLLTKSGNLYIGSLKNGKTLLVGPVVIN